MIEDERKSHVPALFLEHARWLMDAHARRAEGAATRAVAVLGFAGVVLALLLHGATREGLEPTTWTWVFAFACVAALLASAFLALRALSVRAVRSSDVDQLRSWWGEHGRSTQQDVGANLVETILANDQPSEDSPIAAIEREATERVDWLERAAWSLGLALLGLAALGLNVVNIAHAG